MMNISMKQYINFKITWILIILLLTTTACEKTQSYSELLREEEKAVNWYLSSQIVMLDLPEKPSDFITCEMAGENAPFYKIDPEGYVYMQIVSADFEDIVDEGDLVYFRFSRENISYMYEGIDQIPEGNSDFLSYGPTSFVYKNSTLTSTTRWGTGIQMPLKYVGFNSEVNLVLRSYYGFSQEQSTCVPYLINLRYFKPEY